MYDSLQKREIFHLTFLRVYSRSAPGSTFVLKGGCNLRFFFGSIRYSEDMDLDASGIAVHILQDKVMRLLASPTLADTLRTFGIDRIVPPTLSKAKETETVQRFKIHLITPAGEDLSTKIEFSRRGFDIPVRAESVTAPILANYRMTPLILPHYAAIAAVRQKIRALAARRQVEARDIFDLYALSTHPDVVTGHPTDGVPRSAVEEARQRIFSVTYEQYRDTVIAFLAPDDRETLDSTQTWDEIRLRVAALFDRGGAAGDE